MEMDASIRQFLDAQGRLKALPAKRKARLPALAYLAKGFEPGRTYSEKEVNEQLEARHTFHDPATLRRELYNNGYLERERDGSAYRLAATPPEA